MASLHLISMTFKPQRQSISKVLGRIPRVLVILKERESLKACLKYNFVAFSKKLPAYL